MRSESTLLVGRVKFSPSSVNLIVLLISPTLWFIGGILHSVDTSFYLNYKLGDVWRSKSSSSPLATNQSVDSIGFWYAFAYSRIFSLSGYRHEKTPDLSLAINPHTAPNEVQERQEKSPQIQSNITSIMLIQMLQDP